MLNKKIIILALIVFSVCSFAYMENYTGTSYDNFGNLVSTQVQAIDSIRTSHNFTSGYAEYIVNATINTNHSLSSDANIHCIFRQNNSGETGDACADYWNGASWSNVACYNSVSLPTSDYDVVFTMPLANLDETGNTSIRCRVNSTLTGDSNFQLNYLALELNYTPYVIYTDETPTAGSRFDDNMTWGALTDGQFNRCDVEVEGTNYTATLSNGNRRCDYELPLADHIYNWNYDVRLYSNISDDITQLPLITTSYYGCGAIRTDETLFHSVESHYDICFYIQAGNSLDCDNYKVHGNKVGSYGIDIEESGTLVKNCEVSNFSRGVNVENTEITQIYNMDLLLNQVGAYMTDTNDTQLENISAQNNTQYAIRGLRSNWTDMRSIDSYDNYGGVFVTFSDYVRVADSFIGKGIYFAGVRFSYVTNAEISNNFINNTAYGILLENDENISVFQNEINVSGNDGIKTDTCSDISFDTINIYDSNEKSLNILASDRMNFNNTKAYFSGIENINILNSDDFIMTNSYIWEAGSHNLKIDSSNNAFFSGLNMGDPLAPTYDNMWVSDVENITIANSFLHYGQDGISFQNVVSNINITNTALLSNDMGINFDAESYKSHSPFYLKDVIFADNTQNMYLHAGAGYNRNVTMLNVSFYNINSQPTAFNLSDDLFPPEGYILSSVDVPHIPSSYKTFMNKSMNITGTNLMSIDELKMLWEPSELSGEPFIYMFKYNSTDDELMAEASGTDYFTNITSVSLDGEYGLFSYIGGCEKIDTAGYYTLSDDLTGVLFSEPYLSGKSCIWINSSNVHLNCFGHTLTNNDLVSGSRGISVSSDDASILTNITIENCNIVNYSIADVMMYHVSGGSVSDIEIDRDGEAESGIRVSSYSSNIEIYDNFINGTGWAINSNGQNISMYDNEIENAVVGYYITNMNVSASSSQITNTLWGAYFYNSWQPLIYNLTIRNATSAGIFGLGILNGIIANTQIDTDNGILIAYSENVTIMNSNIDRLAASGNYAINSTNVTNLTLVSNYVSNYIYGHILKDTSGQIVGGYSRGGKIRFESTNPAGLTMPIFSHTLNDSSNSSKFTRFVLTNPLGTTGSYDLGMGTIPITPIGEKSVNGKNIQLTNSVGTIHPSGLTMYWDVSDEVGKVPANFKLYEYRSGAWNNTGATLTLLSRNLALGLLQPVSSNYYAILEDVGVTGTLNWQSPTPDDHSRVSYLPLQLSTFTNSSIISCHYTVESLAGNFNLTGTPNSNNCAATFSQEALDLNAQYNITAYATTAFGDLISTKRTFWWDGCSNVRHIEGMSDNRFIQANMNTNSWACLIMNNTDNVNLYYSQNEEYSISGSYANGTVCQNSDCVEGYGVYVRNSSGEVQLGRGILQSPVSIYGFRYGALRIENSYHLKLSLPSVEIQPDTNTPSIQIINSEVEFSGSNGGATPFTGINPAGELYMENSHYDLPFILIEPNQENIILVNSTLTSLLWTFGITNLGNDVTYLPNLGYYQLGFTPILMLSNLTADKFTFIEGFVGSSINTSRYDEFSDGSGVTLQQNNGLVLSSTASGIGSDFLVAEEGINLEGTGYIVNINLNSTYLTGASGENHVFMGLINDTEGENNTAAGCAIFRNSSGIYFGNGGDSEHIKLNLTSQNIQIGINGDGNGTFDCCIDGECIEGNSSTNLNDVHFVVGMESNQSQSRYIINSVSILTEDEVLSSFIAISGTKDINEDSIFVDQSGDIVDGHFVIVGSGKVIAVNTSILPEFANLPAVIRLNASIKTPANSLDLYRYSGFSTDQATILALGSYDQTVNIYESNYYGNPVSVSTVAHFSSYTLREHSTPPQPSSSFLGMTQESKSGNGQETPWWIWVALIGLAIILFKGRNGR